MAQINDMQASFLNKYQNDTIFSYKFLNFTCDNDIFRLAYHSQLDSVISVFSDFNKSLALTGRPSVASSTRSGQVGPSVNFVDSCFMTKQ